MTQLSYSYARRWGVPQSARLERSIVARKDGQVVTIREFRDGDLVLVQHGDAHHWHRADQFGFSPQWDAQADLVFLELVARLEDQGYGVHVGRGTFTRVPTRQERIAQEVAA